MSDKRPDELAPLSGLNFDLPMTDAFVTRVHRGVRRRRTIRLVTAAAGVAALIFAVAVRWPQPPPATPTPAASASIVAPRLLDGYEIKNVPGGLRVTDGDSFSTYAVEPNHLRNDGPGPSAAEPTAAVTMRIFVRPNGGNYLWITVLRPERTTPAASRHQITQWLVGWSTAGMRTDETFSTPAGEARLVSAGISRDVVITTPDGVVITVGGAGVVPPTDLKFVAAGIHPR